MSDKRFRALIGVVLLLTTLPSCCVVFGGRRYIGTIKVINNPNASIWVQGIKLGEGQVTRRFLRSKPLLVEVKQEGCPTKHVIFDNAIRTENVVLTYLTLGTPGCIVDIAAGAVFKPAHKTDPTIKKINFKKFDFEIDYANCAMDTVAQMAD